MSFFKNLFSKWNDKLFWGYSNYFLFNNSPQWLDLKKTQALFDLFCTNPIYYATVMIKARETANMKFCVENKKTGETEPEDTTKEIPAKIYKLLNKPNPFQSRWEFLNQQKIFREVAGNSFVYATTPLGVKKSISDITTLKNIWPQYMEVKLTGQFFEATNQEDVIEKWRFNVDSYKKEFEPSQILHRNNPNIDTKDDLILGKSAALSLLRPLSNINLAYESRNVLLKNRGMRGIFTSDKSDAMGRLTLQNHEKNSVIDELKEYGNLESQNQFFFTAHPLKYTPIDQDVRKLGLFEEIATDAMIVANAHGVPEILVKAYLEGTTFENQEASIRRLYQGTIIPEAMDDITALNTFLGLDETEWEIKGTFDHIPALQKSEKDKADANKNMSAYLERLFLMGGITLNTWLDQLELPKMPDGDITIFEMEDARRNIILSMMGKSASASGGTGNASPSEEKIINGMVKELINN